MPGRLKTPAIQRIWPHVERREADECWPWTGRLTERGRPLVGGGPGEKGGNATRFILEEKLGRRLRPGYEACHTCDWPACCNPAHLWEGTHAENVADRDAKGRTVRGERHPRSKLTDAQVRELRRYPAGPAETARVFGVSACHVTNIRSNRTQRGTI